MTLTHYLLLLVWRVFLRRYNFKRSVFIQKIFYFIPAIAVISACSSGGWGSDPLIKKQFNQTPPNTRVLSNDAGTIGTLNADGVKLTA